MHRFCFVTLSLLALGGACHVVAQQPHAAAPHAAHWSYRDQAHWGETCGVGHAQSPIALTAAPNENLPDLVTHYAEGPGRLFNNGHTVQFAVADGSSLSIGDETFQLGQFHVHTPSEHTLRGAHYPAEFHF